jgi:hypothetical protein
MTHDLGEGGQFSFGMMMWHVIPRHINLGPHISMS